MTAESAATPLLMANPAALVAAVAAAPSSCASAPIVFSTAVRDISHEQSAPTLRAFAQRCLYEEGIARCPFVLLQALALARQFKCLHPPPVHAESTNRYARELRAHGSSTARPPCAFSRCVLEAD